MKNFAKLRREFFEGFGKHSGDNEMRFSPNTTLREVFNWFEFKLTTKTRSNAQNAALHLYLTQIADQLNNAGYTFTNALDLEIPFTMELIKESIFKPTMKELFGINSTTKLTTEMINQMIDVFSLHFGQKGIYIEFPSIQSFLNKLDNIN